MTTKQLSELRKLQRHQLLKINKDELIESILSSDERHDELDKINKRFDEIMAEMQSMKTMIASSVTQMKKDYTELKLQVEKQGEIISKQQQFLEVLDRREREANVVILEVPNEHEELDGVVMDQDKINKIWMKWVCLVWVARTAGWGRQVERRLVVVHNPGVVPSCSH